MPWFNLVETLIPRCCYSCTAVYLTNPHCGCASTASLACSLEPGFQYVETVPVAPCSHVAILKTAERQITFTENPAAFDDEAAAASGLYQTHLFTFDHVYDITCNQRKVYETTAKAVVDSSLQGYNATIFAYGQTGSGKTFTMFGPHWDNNPYGH